MGFGFVVFDRVRIAADAVRAEHSVRDERKHEERRADWKRATADVQRSTCFQTDALFVYALPRADHLKLGDRYVAIAPALDTTRNDASFENSCCILQNLGRRGRGPGAAACLRDARHG